MEPGFCISNKPLVIGEAFGLIDRGQNYFRLCYLLAIHSAAGVVRDE